MSFSDLPLFSLLRENMRWLGQRQSVLAENVANADTPGYRARDLAPQDFAAMLKRARAGEGVGPDARVEENRTPYEVTLSGNTVALDEQLMKVSETAARFQLATSLYTKHLAMIRMALGGR
mgnify:CR=1 FL=1|jgi:flagellar basal-body rod protein FlgB